MNVKSWLKATKKRMSDRQKVIDELSTSINYLHQLSSGHKIPTTKYSLRLEAASKKYTPYAVMLRGDLRPDIWGDAAAA